MKVLIDTNVILSYLLASDASRTVTSVVRRCFEQEEIDLLVPSQQIQELAETVAAKRYFRERVPQEIIHYFIEQSTAFSQLPPPLEEIAAYTCLSLRVRATIR